MAHLADTQEAVAQLVCDILHGWQPVLHGVIAQLQQRRELRIGAIEKELQPTASTISAWPSWFRSATAMSVGELWLCSMASSPLQLCPLTCASGSAEPPGVTSATATNVSSPPGSTSCTVRNAPV